jgi:hypothetical protein
MLEEDIGDIAVIGIDDDLINFANLVICRPDHLRTADLLSPVRGRCGPGQTLPVRSVPSSSRPLPLSRGAPSQMSCSVPIMRLPYINVRDVHSAAIAVQEAHTARHPPACMTCAVCVQVSSSLLFHNFSPPVPVLQ